MPLIVIQELYNFFKHPQKFDLGIKMDMHGLPCIPWWYSSLQKFTSLKTISQHVNYIVVSNQQQLESSNGIKSKGQRCKVPNLITILFLFLGTRHRPGYQKLMATSFLETLVEKFKGKR